MNNRNKDSFGLFSQLPKEIILKEIVSKLTPEDALHFAMSSNGLLSMFQNEGMFNDIFWLFLHLPKDVVLHHIVPELDFVTTKNLAISCKTTLSMFQNDGMFTLEARLAHYVVVEPNDDEVRKILDKHPELVKTIIKKVTDNAGRTIINSTPLQLAYYAGDEKMCETLKPYIIKVCGSEEAGLEDMRRQIKEKEVQEGEETTNQIKEHLASLLAAVIQAITNEQFNNGRDLITKKWILSDATLQAIQTFKEAFAATQPKIIDKGIHFRLETLPEMCEACQVAAKQQWNYDYKKCALFDDGVLAPVLEYAPENVAQSLKQGLFYLQDKGEEFKRAKLTRNGRHFYRALRSGSVDFRLGSSCVDIVWGGAGSRPTSRSLVAGAGGPQGGAARCKTYVEQKLQSCKTYATTLSSQNNVSVRDLLK